MSDLASVRYISMQINLNKIWITWFVYKCVILSVQATTDQLLILSSLYPKERSINWQKTTRPMVPQDLVSHITPDVRETGRDPVIFKAMEKFWHLSVELGWGPFHLETQVWCVLCCPINMFSLSPQWIKPPHPLLLQAPSIKMFKHRYGFEGTPLLGNWMLNLRLDWVCIRSCSVWLPLPNDLLISNLSSALPSLLVRAWISSAVRMAEIETVTASHGLIWDVCSQLLSSDKMRSIWQTQHKLASKLHSKSPYCSI